jgi:hypothetical protein
MAGKGRKATPSVAETGGFWQPCQACGVRAKASDDQTEEGTGRVFHRACQPKGFKAFGDSIGVEGYTQRKWGQPETTKPGKAESA